MGQHVPSLLLCLSSRKVLIGVEDSMHEVAPPPPPHLPPCLPPPPTPHPYPSPYLAPLPEDPSLPGVSP